MHTWSKGSKHKHHFQYGHTTEMSDTEVTKPNQMKGEVIIYERAFFF